MTRLSSLLALIALTLGASSPYLNAQDEESITPTVLPIEVLGADGYTVPVTVYVKNVTTAERLYLQVHRPAYRDVATNPSRGAKASLQINDGPWVDLTPDAVTCLAHEAALGCLESAYHTLRFTVDLDRFQAPLVRGANAVSFRFNGTDGITFGYRVLDIDVLTSAGASLVHPKNFVEEDPSLWTPPRPGAADLAAGEALWRSAVLVESPLAGAPEIRATCASCHADDGRDLKYFNYSNRSIQERALFHGLSQTEAEQVASYIRSLEAPVPAGARPWNPPYQPGQALDDRPVDEWAAGAGLEAVLEADDDVAGALFPGPITAEAVAADATLNARELPIALQLPDWNAWLPEVHPEDVWGEFFLDTTPVTGTGDDSRGDVLGHYDRLVELLEDDGVPASIASGKLVSYLQTFADAGGNYFWDPAFGGGEGRVPAGMRDETAQRALHGWMAVKLWAIHHAYGLEDEAGAAYGDEGEARSWLGAAHQVFTLSPHFTSDAGEAFAYQTLISGTTETTSWYHLQMVMNAGNRNADANAPVNWNYHPSHIFSLADEATGGPAHPWRAAATWAKLIQTHHHDGDLLDEPYARAAHPGRWGGVSVFDGLDAHTRAELFTALITAYMDAVESHPTTAWDRPADPETANRWEPASYRPVTITDMTWSNAHNEGRYADLFYTMVPAFRLWGVGEDALARMADWGERMWPLADWDAVRGPSAVVGSGDGLAATYFSDATLSEADFARTDSVVAFRWSAGKGPGGDVGHNQFSARWEGYVAPYFDGQVTFHLTSDDGSRLWVDDRLVIDQWESGGVVEGEATVTLSAVEAVPIRLEYFEETLDAEVELSWSGPYLERQVVAQSQLYTEEPGSLAPPAAGEAEGSLSVELGAPSPNPFGSETVLSYAVPEAGRVRVSAYDLLGRRVAVLVDEEQGAGRYAARLSGLGLASGVYVVRLEAGGEVRTQKVSLVR